MKNKLMRQSTYSLDNVIMFGECFFFSQFIGDEKKMKEQKYDSIRAWQRDGKQNKWKEMG